MIGDYQQTQIRPGKKATDIPKRLLNPEAHMKQTKLTKGKKKKTGLCTNLKQKKWVCTSYVCDECGVALCIWQCWGKNNTKKPLYYQTLKNILVVLHNLLQCVWIKHFTKTLHTQHKRKC